MKAEVWVVRIRTAPAEPCSREMLELVLAGASLELDLVVVFSGPGAGHLQADAFAQWRQLIDFDLAPVLVEGGPGTTPACGVREVTAGEVDRLCQSAAGVLEL